jgi:hypothetical protein
LLGRFEERASRVESLVPGEEIGLREEAVALGLVGESALVEACRVPAVKDVADVEDDGGRSGPAGQPWRALKRRFVLLMT